ncbi:MAG: serine protease, partial [Sarcina sp.]
MIDLKREHCKHITQKYYELFLKKKNVVGLAFGNKIINNIDTGEPCLKVFVSTKESELNLDTNDLIPKTYDG